jgi:hypothetical protein
VAPVAKFTLAIFRAYGFSCFLNMFGLPEAGRKGQAFTRQMMTLGPTRDPNRAFAAESWGHPRRGRSPCPKAPGCAPGSALIEASGGRQGRAGDWPAQRHDERACQRAGRGAGAERSVGRHEPHRGGRGPEASDARRNPGGLRPAVAVMPPARRPPSRRRPTCGSRWRRVPWALRRASTPRR